MKLLERFIKNVDTFCFSQIQNELFGFLPGTTINEKIHDMIKSIIPFSKPFTVTVKKITEYLEQLGVKCFDYKL